MQFFFLLPNRSLPYLKVMQGERNKKENVIFLLLPNRSLPYLKVVQDEHNKKESLKTFLLLDKLQFGPLGARAYNSRPKGFIAAIFSSASIAITK